MNVNEMENQLAVTQLNQLKTYVEGDLIRLPDFAEGQTFVARVRRPSMLAMVKSGKIPNNLLAIVGKLFLSGSTKELNYDDPQVMLNLIEVFSVFSQACLVEPTYEQLQEIGLELTDQQLTFIFNYAQTGIKSLENFREESSTSRIDRNGKNVQRASK